MSGYLLLGRKDRPGNRGFFAATATHHHVVRIDRRFSSIPSALNASYGIRVNGIRNLMPSGATNGSW
jgi:hypothetical protein